MPSHRPDCSFLLGLACTCGAGDRPQSEEAQDMQAFLTGWLSQSLYVLTEETTSPLRQPVTFEQIDANGSIVIRLASGLIASIAVHVE
jgi:hypothetical protein